MRIEVKVFAELMEAQLARHDDRPGWKSESPDYLFSRFLQEVQELHDAMLHRFSSRTEVVEKAANVANFAMMIADVCGALLKESR